MSNKRFWIYMVVLGILFTIIRIYSANSSLVETNYSLGFYPYWGLFLRLLFGWLPFSVGDILYGLFGCWLLWKFIRMIRAIIKRSVNKKRFLRGLKDIVLLVGVLYVVFNLSWGINYNRQGIFRQLNLTDDTLNYDQLKQITLLLTDKLNITKKYLEDNHISYPTNNELFKKINAAYQKAATTLSFLQYKPSSIKSSLWGWIGNYTGFTGYYNPFTGEAQLNTTVPKFMQPFVACHEVGHQVGYAKENEASSVGYLAALYSGDSLLLYSTYFDLYNYASRELLFQSYIHKDTSISKQYTALLIPGVIADIGEMQSFFQRHRNPIEPYIRKGYGFYLKSNMQPKGINSYDDVTGFLVAYYKKFGRI